jgi:16S rRNA (uracil1498-N3)-methyltransferase|tara:strand:- start:1110 stop:1823 length:714 start_codon:yes stop_codon:yes gene_type:complete
MSNIRLFFPENLSLNLTAKLDKSQSHYVNKVMRVKVNETFSLFNESVEWEAKIKEISNGIVGFIITKQLRQKENSKEIWLAFSPIKSNYFNFMIQKATELGVTKFIPVITDRTIVRKINYERVENITIEASEQSNRLLVPKVEKIQNLKSFLEKNNNKINIIFGDINTKNQKLDPKIQKEDKPICIIIGPEGDFTEAEREQILNFKDVQSLKINDNILRTETAAISALSIINYFLNL